MHDRVCARKSNVLNKDSMSASGASKRINCPSLVLGSHTWRLLSTAVESTPVADETSPKVTGDTDQQELLSVSKKAHEVVNPGQGKYMHVSLSQVLEVIVKRFADSMHAWDDSTFENDARAVQHPLPWHRRIQELSTSADEVRQPSILVFLVLQSVLAQAVRLGRDSCKTQDNHVMKVIQELCATVIKLLHTNVRAVLTSGMSLAACGMQYSRQADAKGEKPLVSKLLMLLLHFINSTDPRCRVEAAACVASGLSIFMPHPSDQAHLMECLLSKKVRGRGVGSSAEVDLSSSPFAALSVLSTSGNEVLLKALFRRFVVPEHTAELVPYSMRPLLTDSLALQPPNFRVAESSRTENDVHEVLDEVAPSYNGVGHGNERLVPLTSELSEAPQPGFLVCRGPDWVYDEQDGGKGRVGVVLEVCDWLGSPAKCLRVQWQHGTTNYYRWNVESSPIQFTTGDTHAHSEGTNHQTVETSPPSRRRNLYDVCVLRPASESDCISADIDILDRDSVSRENIQTRETVDKYGPPLVDRSEGRDKSHMPSLGSDIRSRVGNETTAVPIIDSSDRRVLEYTPDEVYQSLIQEAGPLTKRSILAYMREIAPMDWQQRHRLTWSLNSLVKSLSSQETVDLYIAFFSEFSSKEAPTQHVRGGSEGGRDPEGDGKDGEYQSKQLLGLMALLINVAEMSSRVQSIFSIPSASPIVDDDNDDDHDDDDLGHASLQVLMILQVVLTGRADSIIVGNDMSHVSVHNPISSDSIAVEVQKHAISFTGHTFSYHDGKKPADQSLLRWEWVNGTYDSDHVGDVSGQVVDTFGASGDVVVPLSTDTIFMTNDSGAKEHPLVYAKGRTAVYTLPEAWSSLLLTSPCNPNSGMYSWGFRVSTSRSTDETQESSLKFFCGLTSDPSLDSTANISEHKDSWCVSADGAVFVHGGLLVDRSVLGLPKMDASVPALNDTSLSSSHDKDTQGDCGTGQQRCTALYAAHKYGCDVVVQFLFDSVRGVLLCRFGVERVHRVAANAIWNDAKASACTSCSEEWQVVCTNLEGMKLYPAVSIHSKAFVELIRCPVQSTSSVKSAVEKATSASTATIAAAAMTRTGQIQDQLQDTRGNVPSNLSHAFARSFAELIRTKARAAGIRSKSSGKASVSGPSTTSRNVLGVCSVGAPSSLLVGYALKLARTATDMLSDERSDHSSHPLVGYLLLHLVASFVKFQHVNESQAPALFASFKALQATIGRLRVRLSSFDVSDVKSVGPRMLLNMLGCATSALLGRYVAAWISLQGSELEVDNRILVEECRLSATSDSYLGDVKVNGTNIGVRWSSDHLFSQGLIGASEKSKVTKEAEFVLKYGQDMFTWLAASERSGTGGGVGLRVGGMDLNVAVLSMFTAAVYHVGKLEEVAHLVEEHSSTPFKGSPPPYLSHCWDVSNSLRIQARRLRSSSELSYHTIAHVYTARANFLLEVRTRSNMRIFPGPIQPGGEQDDVISVVRSIYSFVTDAHSVASSVPNVKSALKTADLHALYRCEGIKGLHQILTLASDEMPVVFKNALLLHYPRAFRGDSGNCLYRGREDCSSDTNKPCNDEVDSCHYLFGLHSCSAEEKKNLKGAYDGFFSHITSELRSVGAAGAGDTLEDMSYKLTLLNCLGMRIKEEDHALIARVQILMLFTRY